MKQPRLALILMWLMLLASSMASSFAPISTTSVRHRKSALESSIGMSGGADEEIFQRPPPPSAEGGKVLQSGKVLQRPIPTDEANPGISKAAPSTIEQISQVSRLGPNASPPGFLRQKFPAVPWHLVPNWLTYLRCLAIPVLIGVFYMPGRHMFTSGLFALAAATDYLDGYLARRWDITSEFGAFLDPVADKLMVSTSLILLVGRYGTRVAIPTAVILAREQAVSALREWMAGQGLRDKVQVGYQGKVKTALTMVVITLLLLLPQDGAGMLGNY